MIPDLLESETNGRKWSTSRHQLHSLWIGIPNIKYCHTGFRNASKLQGILQRSVEFGKAIAWLIQHTGLSPQVFESVPQEVHPLSASPQIQNGIAVVGTGLIGRLLTKSVACWAAETRHSLFPATLVFLEMFPHFQTSVRSLCQRAENRAPKISTLLMGWGGVGQKYRPSTYVADATLPTSLRTSNYVDDATLPTSLRTCN